MDFANNLKILRNEKGLNQSQLANVLGVSRGSISFYETGERVPDAEVLKKMAAFFGVTSDYLIGLTDVKSVDIQLQKICEYTGLNENSVCTLQSLQHCKDSKRVFLYLNFLLGNFYRIKTIISSFRRVIIEKIGLKSLKECIYQKFNIDITTASPFIAADRKVIEKISFLVSSKTEDMDMAEYFLQKNMKEIINVDEINEIETQVMDAEIHIQKFIDSIDSEEVFANLQNYRQAVRISEDFIFRWDGVPYGEHNKEK